MPAQRCPRRSSSLIELVQKALSKRGEWLVSRENPSSYAMSFVYETQKDVLGT